MPYPTRTIANGRSIQLTDAAHRVRKLEAENRYLRARLEAQWNLTEGASGWPFVVVKDVARKLIEAEAREGADA
jgi:hypothetical protein